MQGTHQKFQNKYIETMLHLATPLECLVCETFLYDHHLCDPVCHFRPLAVHTLAFYGYQALRLAHMQPLELVRFTDLLGLRSSAERPTH
jgi:hypothetical protein